MVMSACSVQQSEPVTITGYILSSATDENDNPVGVYLFDGKDEYHIADNKLEKELLDLVDQRVEVQGVASQGGGGKQSLVVEKYKKVED